MTRGRRGKRVTAATGAPAGEQRLADERRLPGYGPEALSALGLTRREIAVLEFVAEGRTNWQIGDSLKLSPLTVKKHLERMYAKVGATNRASLVAVAWQRSRPAEPPPSARRRADAKQ